MQLIIFSWFHSLQESARKELLNSHPSGKEGRTHSLDGLCSWDGAAIIHVHGVITMLVKSAQVMEPGVQQARCFKQEWSLWDLLAETPARSKARAVQGKDHSKHCFSFLLESMREEIQGSEQVVQRKCSFFMNKSRGWKSPLWFKTFLSMWLCLVSVGLETKRIPRMPKSWEKNLSPVWQVWFLIFFFSEELISFHNGQSIAACTMGQQNSDTPSKNRRRKKTPRSSRVPMQVWVTTSVTVKLLLYTLGAPSGQGMPTGKEV